MRLKKYWPGRVDMMRLGYVTGYSQGTARANSKGFLSLLVGRVAFSTWQPLPNETPTVRP